MSNGMKDFEVPLGESIKDRLDKMAHLEGQASAALARSLIIEGLQARERHAMELAKYQSTNITRQNTPQKTR